MYPDRTYKKILRFKPLNASGHIMLFARATTASDIIGKTSDPPACFRTGSSTLLRHVFKISSGVRGYASNQRSASSIV